jgi:hypothetical protein
LTQSTGTDMANQQSKSWVKVAQAYVSTEEPTSVVAAGDGASTPAPKKDQVKGSKRNKPGSADGQGKITFGERTETALRNKLEQHNEKAPKGRKATMSMLKAVYRRGAGAYSTSHRPGKSRDQWAMARVNAFLKLLKSGKPDNSAYKQDNDLLPVNHPKSSKKSNSAITASGLIPEERDFAEAILEVVAKHGKFDEDGSGVWAGYTPASENEDAGIGVICANCVFYSEDEEGNDVCQIISLPIEDLGKCRLAVIPDGKVKPENDRDELALDFATFVAEQELTISDLKKEEFSTTRDAILALTELSGLGYEAEFAIKASWMRALNSQEDPFFRAKDLATLKYDSRDADLLPIQKESTEL